MSKLKRKAHSGFTLIEVLIAVLLLAIGVLGLAGSQLGALKYNKTSSGRTQASFLAYTIADAMRANKKNASSYVVSMGSSAPTGSTIANKDLANWINALASQLPEGTGSIACSCNASDTYHTITITVRWSEGRTVQSSTTENPDTQSFVMVTQI